MELNRPESMKIRRVDQVGNRVWIEFVHQVRDLMMRRIVDPVVDHFRRAGRREIEAGDLCPIVFAQLRDVRRIHF